MVVTDIQACFAAGALFADLAAPAILTDSPAANFRHSAIYARLRQRVLFFSTLFLAPSATLFMLAWPGWETQYLGLAFVHTASVPRNALPFALFVILLTAGAWFGNWLGFKWVHEGARVRLRVVYSTVLVATVVVLLARWPAPIRLGPYDDFVRKPEALPYIWQDTTFFVWFCALTLYCTVALVAMAWLARRETGEART